MFFNKWTEKEEEILRQMYGIKPTSVLAELLSKTEWAIRAKANKLKLTKPQSYNENLCRLEDEFDGGNYYKKLDYAKTLDSNIVYVSDAWAKYGRAEFEIMFNNFNNG